LLAESIHDLLALPGANNFAKGWKVEMAKMIANAIGNDELLYRAKLHHDGYGGDAIFVVESIDAGVFGSEGWMNMAKRLMALGQFTMNLAVVMVIVALLAGNHLMLGIYLQILCLRKRARTKLIIVTFDRYVSMEVDVIFPPGGMPRLVLRIPSNESTHGLCFFTGCHGEKVIFLGPS
jgi:hypothetical protein